MTNVPYKIIHLEQGSHDWHVWRRSKITASNAAAIMGLDPWTTPLMLYNRILSDEQITETDAMKHGKETEAEARGWLALKTGKAYIPMCMESIEYPWMGCSLDGWREHLDPKAIEIKCPMKTIEQFAKLDEIPVYHFCQMQHQMAVCGISTMYYLTYSKISQEGLILTIKRDELFIKKLIECEKTFYDRLGSFDPPEPIDGRDIFILDDPEAVNEADRYKQLCKDIEALEILKERSRKYLIDKADGRSIKAGNLKITKTVRRGNIDYANIPELQNINLEPYRKKPIESWRFS